MVTLALNVPEPLVVGDLGQALFNAVGPLLEIDDDVRDVPGADAYRPGGRELPRDLLADALVERL